MADQFYPPKSIHDIATQLEQEAATLKCCIELMQDSLMFVTSDEKAATLAQAHLFFLVDSLKTMMQRFDTLSSETYSIARADKAAA